MNKQIVELFKKKLPDEIRRIIFLLLPDFFQLPEKKVSYYLVQNLYWECLRIYNLYSKDDKDFENVQRITEQSPSASCLKRIIVLKNKRKTKFENSSKLSIQSSDNVSLDFFQKTKMVKVQYCK